jgi:hypothetical protein
VRLHVPTTAARVSDFFSFYAAFQELQLLYDLCVLGAFPAKAVGMWDVSSVLVRVGDQPWSSTSS